ncbi:MAG: Eco57I restriction-modification methylase domain-containing protein [Pyrinomonadaceae bacterium]
MIWRVSDYNVTTIDLIESTRLQIQSRLDAAKSPAERNKLGQFATSTALATDILGYAKTLLPAGQEVRFFDPAVGTGSFYSALLRVFPPKRIARATGYEIDPHYARQATKLWGDKSLDLRVADFTKATPSEHEEAKANLLVCNPPYVRHHHLAGEEKLRLRRLVEQTAGVSLSGLAGLYCYFMCLSRAWLAPGGLSGWLVPGEFMDVNYGRQIKEFLLSRVTLLRVHRFDPNNVQFDDALVSSAVVWFRNNLPPKNHAVEFSFGGTLAKPVVTARVPGEVLRAEVKWTKFPTVGRPDASIQKSVKLSDLFSIKRGLATGANDFFVLTPEQVKEHDLPDEFLLPILPSPRYLSTDEIRATTEGGPVTDRELFLLACDLPESEVKERCPTLWRYFKLGAERRIKTRYLCRNRSPWYAQEHRPPAPLLCTYMGRQNTKRGRPFRFILNHSNATAANVYLMLYPRPAFENELRVNPQLLRVVWQFLNQTALKTLTDEGRTYGGGLHKLEPKELGNVPVDESILAPLG